MLKKGDRIRYRNNDYEVVEVYMCNYGIYYKVIDKYGKEHMLHESLEREFYLSEIEERDKSC